MAMAEQNGRTELRDQPIVTIVYGAVAAVLALQGKNKVQEATPPVPERAVDSTKEDVAWVKTRAKSARE
jgi:hypothetical protein